MSLLLLFNGPLLDQAPAPPEVVTGFSHGDVDVAARGMRAAVAGSAGGVEVEGRARTQVGGGAATTVAGRGRRTTLH